MFVNETGAGGAHTEIQAAVDIAGPGDLILVADGDYSGFVVDGKSLRIVADTNSAPAVIGSILIQNLFANESVELSGFAQEFTIGATNNLTVVDCVGPVLIQDCEVFSQSFGFFQQFAGALRITNSNAVTILRSTFDMQAGIYQTGTGRAAAVTDSNAYFYDCDLLGAQVFDLLLTGDFGETGLSGLQVTGGHVLLSGCRVTGGTGEDGSSSPFDPCFVDGKNAGDGGPAIQLDAGVPSPILTLVDSVLTPGQPGQDAGCGSGITSPFTVLTNAGAVTNSPTTSRRFTMTPIVRTGEILNNEFFGAPFDLTWRVFSATQPTLVYDPLLTGLIYTAAPFNLKYVGLLDSNGRKTKNILFEGTLGADFIPVYGQVFYYNATDRLVVSSPSFTALID